MQSQAAGLSGLTRREQGILRLAAMTDADVRRRQRLLFGVGLWLLAAALLVAAAADVLHWAAESWSALLAVPGMFLLVRAWDLNHARTMRRVLRRLLGQDPA